MIVVWILACLIVGYGFGCFSTSYILGKIHGIDIRNEGSGNAGATNALRTLGVKAGAFTFIGDACKAIIPIVLVRFLVKDVDLSLLLALYTGLGVAMGHNFPFWLHFHGGKGIVVTSAVIISLSDWRVTFIGLLLFILIVAITRYVSLGSLAVAWYLPINMLVFKHGNSRFLHLLIVSLAFTALAYVKHWPNIKRLFNGTENKLLGKKERNGE